MRSDFTKIKRIVLHIGPDKTGSTTIQHSFYDNKEFLNVNAVYYSTGYSYNDKSLVLWFCSDPDWANLITGSPIAKRPQTIQRYQESFHKTLEQLPPNATWVLSYEGLIHLQEKDLEVLKNFLLQVAQDVKIVFYVRDALSYARSAKSQLVKTGRVYKWNQPPYIKYGELLPKFIDIFGLDNIEAKLFDKDALKSGDVFLDFIDSAWSEGIFSNILTPFETSFKRNYSVDTDSYILLQRLRQIFYVCDVSPKNFRKQYRPLWTHEAASALKLSPVEAVIVLILSWQHFLFIKQTFGVSQNVSISRDVGFSSCKNFSKEKQAQSIVINDYNLEDSRIPQKSWRLLTALLHDGLLLPICIARSISQKRFSGK